MVPPPVTTASAQLGVLRQKTRRLAIPATAAGSPDGLGGIFNILRLFDGLEEVYLFVDGAPRKPLDVEEKRQTYQDGSGVFHAIESDEAKGMSWACFHAAVTVDVVQRTWDGVCSLLGYGSPGLKLKLMARGE